MNTYTISNINEARNLVSRTPEGSVLATAARSGGSGIDIAVSGLDGEGEVSRVQLEADTDRKNMDLLFEFFALVSAKAKDLGQTLVPHVLSMSGFPTAEQPNKFVELSEPPLPISASGDDNYFCIANNNFDPLYIFGTHPRQNNLVDLTKLYMDTHRELADIPNNKLYYRDSYTEVNPGIAYALSKSFLPSLEVLNDTVAVAQSATSLLESGQNSLSFVCGSGFNLGKAMGFIAPGKGFNGAVNDEAGHNLCDEKYISPIDLYRKVKPSVEDIFAGGLNSDEDIGIRGQVKFLREKFDVLSFLQSKQILRDLGKVLWEADQINLPESFEADQIKNSPLMKSDQLLTNRQIVELAKGESPDPLAKALCLSWAQRLGEFINDKYGEYLNDNCGAFAITGSHFIDIVKNVPGAKELVFGPCFGELEEYHPVDGTELDVNHFVSMDNQVKIKLVERDQMDGLVDVVKEKAALARSMMN